MAKKKVTGICCLCGRDGELSFEHIPPKAAFNDRRTVQVQFEELVTLGPDVVPRGPVKQGGIGRHSLCPRCNNSTGRWYGGHFVQWCYQGMDVLIRSGGQPALIYLNRLYPLSVLKQIITMFMSVNGDQFGGKNAELVEFVLSKERRHVPSRYRFYVYYNTSARFRYYGLSSIIRFGRGQSIYMSEISYPPFGYVMTINSPPPDTRLADITFFADHEYGQSRHCEVRLTTLPTVSAYPGDYRTPEQILATGALRDPREGLLWGSESAVVRDLHHDTKRKKS